MKVRYASRHPAWRSAMCIISAGLLLGRAAAADLPPPGNDGPSERAYEVAVMSRIVEPILAAGSEGRLRQHFAKFRETSPLEALGRTIAGVAPWLELGPGPDAEGQLRARYIDLAVRAIRNGVDPASPDYMRFNSGQNLVDAAFLAQGLLRAPTQLWGNLDDHARAQVLAALKRTRSLRPGENNWENFSAIIEAAILQFGGDSKPGPIEKDVRDMMNWYKGDGTYGDGREFHWDYYNSYVINPMLWQIVAVCAEHNLPEGDALPIVRARAVRYAEYQERLISPEGTYPIIGRSSTYRFGAFQMLSMAALLHALPPAVSPAQVRCGLNAVIQRVIEAPGTFDSDGWLTVGALGSQPSMAEGYITPGSEYLCTLGLLQLGLPPSDPFWTAPDAPWTEKAIWAGKDMPEDQPLKDGRLPAHDGSPEMDEQAEQQAQ